MSLWKQISTIGYCDSLDRNEQRRIRLLARLNFISGIVLLVYLTSQLYLKIYYFLPFIAIMIGFIIIDLYLLKNQRYILAKHFAVITVATSISFFSLTTGDTYNEVLFVPLITMPLIVFKNKNNSKFYFFLILILIIAIKLLQPEIKPMIILKDDVLYFFKTLNTLTAAAVTYSITFYFKTENESFENKLIEMHDTVTEKNKEITDSIKYAKRIQQSLMPTEKYIEKNFQKFNAKK